MVGFSAQTNWISEKNHNRAPTPPFTGYSVIFEKCLTIGYHDTNRRPTLWLMINNGLWVSINGGTPK